MKIIYKVLVLLLSLSIAVFAKKADELPLLIAPNPMAQSKIAPQYNGYNTAYINGYEGNLFKPNENMTKAEAATIFARLLVNSTDIPGGNSTRFVDVEKDAWYYDAISLIDSKGLYPSVVGNTLDPNADITRGEFVELAFLASDLYEKSDTKFKDVDESHKYYDAIMASARAGLINGYEDGTFRPDATITRAEVVTIINRMLGLSVTENTVDESCVGTVFEDISEHWAKLHILMASNSNVKSKSLIQANKADFEQTDDTISFENDLIKVTLEKEGGKVSDIVYKPTGKSVMQVSTMPYFAYGVLRTGANVLPSYIEVTDDQRLKVSFNGGYEAYFIIEIYDNFFAAELDSNFSEEIVQLNFAYLNFDYESSEEPDSFRASNLSMDSKAGIPHTPGGIEKKYVYGLVHNDINVDVMGAKIGILFSTYDTHRDILKEMTLAIDPMRGTVNLAGGAFALDNKDYNEDYAIIYNINPSNVEQYAKHAEYYDIGVLDLHHGSNFHTGDFNFVSARTPEEQKAGTFIDGATFKERITDVLNEHGVDIAIHSYASAVAKGAVSILSDPQWQKDLCYTTTYTLKGDLSKFKMNIPTYEDASTYMVDDSDMPYSATYGTSQYILIDNEIIRVTKGNGKSDGFKNVQRAQLGTQRAEHKDGAEIRHLTCYAGVFQAIIGSDLFYHIADLHAEAYNESGAVMIYLDCQEYTQKGMGATLDTAYYYYQEFTRRIIAQCERPPIIESAAMGKNLWNAGGRGGAIDTVSRAIKIHKKGHYDNYGKRFPMQFYTMTLGWFDFDTDSEEEYHNTYNKTLFHDDLDYMGSVAIASNYSIVPTGLVLTNSYDGTRLHYNYEYYNVYNRLRKANYFADEVKEKIKSGKYEYRLFEKEEGVYAFREMYYDYHKINNMLGVNDVTGEFNNPFSSHTPFIRIEQRFSTLGNDGRLIMEFDENKDISEIAKTYSFSEINTADKRAFKVRVKGNSKDGAVLISFVSASNVKRDDFFISTDFEGWREFILIDPDNVEYDYSKYHFDHVDTLWVNYATKGGSPNYERLNSVIIATSGEVDGVNIDDIVAYEYVNAPVNNPSVTIGQNTLTFETELNSGEFVEYYPDTNKAYLNYYDIEYDSEGNVTKNEAHVKEITFSGKVSVPKGNYKATYSAEPLTSAPTRAKVVIGMQGEILENPDNWEAPEVDLKTSTLDIVTY